MLSIRLGSRNWVVDVLVIWECDVESGDGIADLIREFLELR